MARYKGTMEDACRIGDLQTVIKLVTKDRKLAKQADEIGITPLHRACANNHMAVVELLLEMEADVNAIDKYGDAPLKKAAYSGHSDIVNILVNHGADVNYKDQNDKLALHHSAEQGQLQSVEAVIDHGSEVNSFSKNGQTPLHLAAQNGHSWYITSQALKSPHPQPQNINPQLYTLDTIPHPKVIVSDSPFTPCPYAIKHHGVKLLTPMPQTTQTETCIITANSMPCTPNPETGTKPQTASPKQSKPGAAKPCWWPRPTSMNPKP